MRLIPNWNNIRPIKSEASLFFRIEGEEVSPKDKIIESVSAAQIVNDFFKLGYVVFSSEVLPDFSSFLIPVKNLTIDPFQPKDISEEIQLEILLFSGDDRRHIPLHILSLGKPPNPKISKLPATIKSMRQLFFTFLSQDKKWVLI